MAFDGHRPASPEELAIYASQAKGVVAMAMDAENGVAYLICKRSRLDLETVVALDFRQLAALSITYIQVAQVLRDGASQIQIMPEGDGRKQ
jgi:hypothetical protein